MTDFRTTEIFAEVWSLATPAYQATEIVGEVWSVMTPAMQLTDFFIELWAPTATAGTRYQAGFLGIEVWTMTATNTAPFFFVIT
ncbi:MAG TPA: hypothetical protein VM639_24635 [Dongiaceae bacterium]|nr:hypothetical protein [Dongiaceae bacterium]